MTLSRRSLITGLISLVAAPAIVRVSSLMPVKVLEPLAPTDEIMALLNERMNHAYRIMRENMLHTLYGDRLVYVDKENPQLVHYTEKLPKIAWDTIKRRLEMQ